MEGLTAAVVPELLVELLSDIFGDVKGVTLVHVEAETSEAALAVGEEFGVEWLKLVLLFDAEVTFAHL
jgi:hypothetical protein